jgi:hypothetical protein
VRKIHYYPKQKIDGVSWYIKEERTTTYMELNRGLVSGIERPEKIEEVGEKYELPPLEYVEPLRLC